MNQHEFNTTEVFRINHALLRAFLEVRKLTDEFALYKRTHARALKIKSTTYPDGKH